MTSRCPCGKIGAERQCCPDIGALCRECNDKHRRAVHAEYPGCTLCGGKAHRGDCFGKARAR